MITVHVENHGSVALEEGVDARQLALQLSLTGPHQAVGVAINGTLRDLSSKLKSGDTVRFFDFEDREGKEVFWHTSAHVLAQAVLRLHPQAQPTIGPPIEEGFYYDFGNLSISEEELSVIEQEMRKIVKENFVSIREEFASKEDALAAFGRNPFKTELIQDLDEGILLTAYRQGEFHDLCRGPHLYNLGKIKALKLTKTSGAYWRGDSRREMLTRIYGVTFPTKEELQAYVKRIEEAKKRDHKILGPKLDLFSLQQEAPGMAFIHPKGMIVWHALIDFWRELHREAGYEEIKTPILLARELWERSGHWVHYRENMFTTSVDNREYAVKPMNCPGCMLYYKTRIHSYREFPLRYGEFGLVHRYEASGALSGLFRVRSFHQDDAHIFLLPHQIRDEILAVLQLAKRIYDTFGLSCRLELSTRPEEGTIGSDEAWEQATGGLRAALEDSTLPYSVSEGEGAFYGPKIDLHLKDALGRTWQCGTIQLDMALPERFELEYTDRDGARRRPIVIHRALFGSMERFIGSLIEQYSGKFPLWISPRQIRILTIADRHADYAHTLARKFRSAGFWTEVDDSQESVGKKVRSAQLDQVNYMLTVGDQEVSHGTATLRTRDNAVHGELDINEFIANISLEKSSRSLVSCYSQP